MPCKMKSIVTLLIFTGCLGVNGFYNGAEQSLKENDELLGQVSARSNDFAQARFFNFSLEGIFNNSLLTLAGIFVVGVILFGNVYISAHLIFRSCILFYMKIYSAMVSK